MNGEGIAGRNLSVAGRVGISYDGSGMSEDQKTEAAAESPQLLIGCIGSGELIYDRLTKVLDEHGLSWTRVAMQLAISRQALTNSIKSPRVKYRLIARVCDVVGRSPFDFFEAIPPEKNRELM